MKIKNLDLNKVAFTLTLIMTALKLDGALVIPWIFVIAPFWILLIAAIVALLYFAIKYRDF